MIAPLEGTMRSVGDEDQGLALACHLHSQPLSEIVTALEGAAK